MELRTAHSGYRRKTNLKINRLETQEFYSLSLSPFSRLWSQTAARITLKLVGVNCRWIWVTMVSDDRLRPLVPWRQYNLPKQIVAGSHSFLGGTIFVQQHCTTRSRAVHSALTIVLYFSSQIEAVRRSCQDATKLKP